MNATWYKDISAMCELALGNPNNLVRSEAAYYVGLLAKPTPEILSKLQNCLLLEEYLDTKAEILAARYRLGVRSDLVNLLELLNTADKRLTRVIINILKDLVERQPPITLIEDLPLLDTALVKAAQSFATERNNIEKVISKLLVLTKRSNINFL